MMFGCKWKGPVLTRTLYLHWACSLESAAVHIFHFISLQRADHFITYLVCFWLSICPSPPVSSSLSLGVLANFSLCSYSLKVVFHVDFFLFIVGLSWSGKCIVVQMLVSPWFGISFSTRKLKQQFMSQLGKRVELLSNDLCLQSFTQTLNKCGSSW